MALPLRAQISVSAALETHRNAAHRRASREAASPLQKADTDTAAPPTTLEAVLQALFASADIAFAGEVLSVEREAGAVAIRWQILDAIRGVDSGAIYTLREWPGLWEGNSARYLPGQRALLLLHAPSVAGYASPVGGGDGLIPLRGDASVGSLDMSLLAQRVLVTDAARLRPAEALRLANGSIAAGDALQAQSAALSRNAATARQHARPQGGAPGVLEGDPIVIAATLPTANSTVEGAVVLGMLHAWQRASVAGR